MGTIIRILIRAVVIMIAAHFVPGVAADNFVAALIFAIVLSLINLIIRPIILLLTLPINILTLGLFTFVINAILIMVAAYLVPGITVSGFVAALLFGIVLAILEAILHLFTNKKD